MNEDIIIKNELDNMQQAKNNIIARNDDMQ